LLVPNLIRGQDNLILEVMLPADLSRESNLKQAAYILAPFLIISHHIVFNFDSEELKSTLTSSIDVLLKASDLYDYSHLKLLEDDPKKIFDETLHIANIMPQI